MSSYQGTGSAVPIKLPTDINRAASGGGAALTCDSTLEFCVSFLPQVQHEMDCVTALTPLSHASVVGAPKDEQN